MDVLVSTDWVRDHLNDSSVRVVEVDVDTAAYDQGHVPGSVGWNWTTQLCDTVVRDVIPKPKLEELLGASGIDNNTTIVLYGDNNNWFAAWAFWQFKLYGHQDVRIMDGGRKKWLAEGKDLSTDAAQAFEEDYTAKDADNSLRAFLPEVQDAVKQKAASLVDVRSPAEFTGEILSPPGLPETCQRGGHIPGAKSMPWAKLANDDGTFKSVAEIKALYDGVGVTGDKPIIAYCRIGERSSHSWFALKYLLGYENVKNYDGSWTEWGNLVGAPSKNHRHEGRRVHRTERQDIDGWPVHIITYRIGDRHYCTIDNVDPGARFARAEGATLRGGRAPGAGEGAALPQADPKIPSSLTNASMRRCALERLARAGNVPRMCSKSFRDNLIAARRQRLQARAFLVGVLPSPARVSVRRPHQTVANSPPRTGHEAARPLMSRGAWS